MENKEDLLVKLIEKKIIDLLREREMLLGVKTYASSVEARIVETSAKHFLLSEILRDYRKVVKEQESEIADVGGSMTDNEIAPPSEELLTHFKSLSGVIFYQGWYIRTTANSQQSPLTYTVTICKATDGANVLWSGVEYVGAPYNMKKVQLAHERAIESASIEIERIEESPVKRALREDV